MKSAITPQRIPRKASRDGLLHADVTAMIREARICACDQDVSDETLASQCIVVIRERVLREIESYARENIR